MHILKAFDTEYIIAFQKSHSRLHSTPSAMVGVCAHFPATVAILAFIVKKKKKNLVVKEVFLKGAVYLEESLVWLFLASQTSSSLPDSEFQGLGVWSTKKTVVE